MLDLKSLLADIACAIVDHPDDVVIEDKSNDDEVYLILHVAESDIGMVIGRHGKIAKSIRMVMKAAATSINKRITVEIS